MTYVLKTDYTNAVYIPYGGAAEFMYCNDPEVIIAGPAETGKTLAACWKLHVLASKYPGSQWAIVRKTYKSMHGSVLQTFARVIKGAGVIEYGGEKVEKYIYPHGSAVWIGGMDNPDKVLSSERDGIYVNQAEELILDDWEKLTTRTTGRNAIVPYPQIFGDCNPAGTKHWIRERAKLGALTIIQSQHRDNPVLFDHITGQITAQGERSLGTLARLTGVRHKRLFEGVWATAEGAVYDIFDAQIHVKERASEEFDRWILAMDEGYTNPAVILLIGVDLDGRLHIAREFYRRGVLQKAVVETAMEWVSEKDVRIVAVDQAAAGLIADLQDMGIPAQGFKGRVLDGITTVQGYLRVQGDGKPRLTVDPTCIETINEFESYAWKPEKDEPMKENDHSMDALRYGLAALDSGATILFGA